MDGVTKFNLTITYTDNSTDTFTGVTWQWEGTPPWALKVEKPGQPITWVILAAVKKFTAEVVT